MLVRAASGQFLLFVDADVAPAAATFDAMASAFDDPRCNLVFFELRPATTARFVRLCFRVAAWHSRLCDAFGTCQGPAPLICVRPAAFKVAGMFDETAGSGANADLIRRVERTCGGTVRVREPALYVSARRFAVEPPLLYALKCVVWGALRATGTRTVGQRRSGVDTLHESRPKT